MNRKFIKRTDIIIVLGIIIFALLILVFQNSGEDAKSAQIYLDSKLISTVSLTENKTFSLEELEGYVFEVKDGAIRVAHSTCKNKVCVNTGYISKSGQTAVCLPQKLAVKTVTTDGFDAVVG